MVTIRQPSDTPGTSHSAARDDDRLAPSSNRHRDGGNQYSNGNNEDPNAQLQQHTQKQQQRKTTIKGESGTWILGKTIGAGSMGKVKLARKSDGSEQVQSLAFGM